MIKIEDKLITISTDNTTYQMKVTEYGHLLHVYYGAKSEGDMSYVLHYYDRGFSPVPNDLGHDRTYSLDLLPQEYSCFGNGDFRTVPLVLEGSKGNSNIDLRFDSAKVIEGKYSLPGLPATYENAGDDVSTLEVILKDVAGGVSVTLRYGVFPHIDVITRSVTIKNLRDHDICVRKASSLELDISWGKYEVIHLRGRYGMERMEERRKLTHGAIVFSSRRGISSHQENPFFMLVEKNTTESKGNCIGFSLLYSGDFSNEIEVDPYEQTRVVMGVSAEQFAKKLTPSEEFTTPEAVMSYSSKGIENLSYNFHRLVRNNICRGKYKNTQRPVLINNWEATYFNFTGEKLVQIAKQASELGVELFVLDDGWFGKRNDDTSGLGDWYVNEEKLGGSLKDVADRIRALGMKFGLWIEPEMISEDSDLYREHPDYAFVTPGRAPVRGRSQLVLDFSRKEVVDNIFGQISKVIDETGIDYLKIDMNRSIHEVYSHTAENQNRGTILHEYVLGMYDFLERLCKRYPDMLIEGCSGGGGRFDMGMLYYVPQIWCSDNTDAVERLWIQHGTSMGYPMSTVGAHVSAVPNHQTGRVTPIRTRGIVAMCGGFGYELDLNLLSEEDKEEVKAQIKMYKEDWKIIQQGRYYRLTNPLDDPFGMAWEYVTDDKKEAILAMTQLKAVYNSPVPFINMRGLIPDATYHLIETDQYIKGSALMNAGIPAPNYMKCEYDSMIVHLRVEE